MLLKSAAKIILFLITTINYLFHIPKMAAAQDIPGAKAIYEELKSRFPGGRRKNEPATE
jgi:hypothetical protein